jgi:hypothetical protein
MRENTSLPFMTFGATSPFAAIAIRLYAGNALPGNVRQALPAPGDAETVTIRTESDCRR